MDNLEQLKNLAKAATTGPWAVEPFPYTSVATNHKTVCNFFYNSEYGRIFETSNAKNNSEFISQCDPTTIMSLIERVETAEKEVAKLNTVLDYMSRRIQHV